MKILAIGNSFSTDATTFLHEIAEDMGDDLQVVNLYIGGCSLETHWLNAQANAPLYSYELNGHATGRMVSIKSALTECKWDIVTLHQASLLSGIEESYEPYFENMLGYVKRYAPNADIKVMQTWAFDDNCTREGFENYGRSQKVMYERLIPCYEKISKKYELPLIRCGEALQALRGTPRFDMSKGGETLCRDGFHMHYIYGRFLLGCIWYQAIFNKSIKDGKFYPTIPDMPTDKEKIDFIRAFAAERM